MELFIILENSYFSSRGLALYLAYIGTSLSKYSLTFVVANLMQNEDVRSENVDDMMGGPSFA